MTISVAAAQEFLDENFAIWVRALSPEVTSTSEGAATLRIPVTEDIARVGGIVSGQALAALADTAMVIACGTSLGEFRPVGTITLDTQFLRPASGDSIRAEAEVTRAGKSMVFASARLVAEPSGKDVALVTATFAR